MAGSLSLPASSRLRKSPPQNDSAHGDIWGSEPADASTTPTDNKTWHPSPSLSMHRPTKSDTYRPSFESTTSRIRKDKSTKHKNHLIPHLKKSPRDSNSIDLSRSALENEGLGIFANLERDRRYYYDARLSGSYTHNRSASGTSQATMSSIGGPGSNHAHPMRQTPRPYTPPRSHAYKSLERDHDTSDRIPWGDYEDAFRRPVRHQSSSISNIDPRHSIQLQTDLVTHFTGSSQTNLGRSSLSHPVDNADTVSPHSRTSLDFSFRPRNRTSTASTDPVARAAAVQAARQAFEDREAAKAAKLEKQNMKAQDRESRKRERKEQEELGRRSRSRFSFSEGRFSEKSGRRNSHGNYNAEYGDSRRSSGAFRVDSPKSAWVLFLMWLQTRIFKLGKKLKKS